MTAFHLKDYDLAVETLERCRELSKPHESIVRKVYAMLAGAYLEKREMAQSKERLEQGLRLFPHDPELLFRAGIIYRELGNLPAAEMCLLNLLHHPETGHIDSIDVSMRGYKAHHNLALIYRDLGRLPDAEAHWKAAVSEHPSFVPSWMGLGQTYLQMRRHEDAMAVADRLASLDPAQAEGLRFQATRAASG
jgi:tetratricopeptide (TPR) repeat protein